MKPHLEQALWNSIGRQEGRTVRDIIGELLSGGSIASPKQAWATLSKWSDKGIYDWGTVMDLGWRATYEKGYAEKCKLLGLLPALLILVPGTLFLAHLIVSC